MELLIAVLTCWACGTPWCVPEAEHTRCHRVPGITSPDANLDCRGGRKAFVQISQVGPSSLGVDLA